MKVSRPAVWLAALATVGVGIALSARARPPAMPPSCTPLPLSGALAGMDWATVVRESGRPVRDEQFRLGTGIDPSRRTLLNVFQRPRDDNRTIREGEWVARGCRTTIWFTARGHRWVSVHAVRSPEGGES